MGARIVECKSVLMGVDMSPMTMMSGVVNQTVMMVFIVVVVFMVMACESWCRHEGKRQRDGKNCRAFHL